MANASTKAITDIDAGTPLDDATATKGKLYVATFSIEKAATNTDGDELHLAKLPSEAKVLSIMLQNDALAGCTDVDLGLYTDGGLDASTAEDADVYADGISLATAGGLTERAFSARDKANVGKYVYEDAGVTDKASGGKYYRLVATLNTGGTAAGTISGYVVYAAT